MTKQTIPTSAATPLLGGDDDTAETRLANTLFIVEATAFEAHLLWAVWSKQSDDKTQYRPDKRQHWEQLNGWGVRVGHISERPVVVSMMWNRIDGHLVMFWEPTSQVVDHVQIDAWLDRHFTGKWDGSTRQASCNAANFHHCAAAIEEANVISK